MPPTFNVYKDKQLVYTGELDGTVELGRQQRPDERPFERRREGPVWRVVVAKINETTISRRQLQLEPLDEGRVRVTNLSSANVLMMEDGKTVEASASRDLILPAVFQVGCLAIRVEGPENEPDLPDLQSLIQPTIMPGSMFGSMPNLKRVSLPKLTESDTEAMIGWLQTVTSVLQSAVSSEDFFQRAAQSVVELVGLDSGRVLLLEEEQWIVAAQKIRSQASREQQHWQPSRKILNKLRDEKRTFWNAAGKSSWSAASLAGVQSVVAAPILDRTGEVIGAVYGDRLNAAVSEGSPGITKMEAMLVETLAGSVATGLARLEQEKATMAAEVRFEQFFSPQLSRRLAAEPDLLKGRDAEVTLLFCDIRGYSRISEKLGPAETFDWIGDVMTVLSDCVSAHNVGSIEYVGDELVGMWGAPDQQPDQARQACRAAIDILAAMPALSQRWQDQAGEPIRVGLGINTGIARVGNTGSSRKFKYGSLGGTVNLASRVQGANKFLKTSVLVTAATHARLDDSFTTRKLCKVRVVNIAESVDLYELRPSADAGWESLRKNYELALNDFESMDFRQAASRLGSILAEHPDDGPSLVLLSRVIELIINSGHGFDAAWELPGK